MTGLYGKNRCTLGGRLSGVANAEGLLLVEAVRSIFLSVICNTVWWFHCVARNRDKIANGGELGPLAENCQRVKRDILVFLKHFRDHYVKVQVRDAFVCHAVQQSSTDWLRLRIPSSAD